MGESRSPLLVFGGTGRLAREIGALATETKVPAILLPRSKCDLTRPDDVADAVAVHRPAIVVNAAAFTRVDEAEERPDEAFRVNEAGVATLGRVCAAHDVALIHVSTDYVFDGGKSGAYREDDPIAPLSIYGKSKAAGEAALRQIGGRYLILRSSWVYGVYGNNFLKTMLRLAAERTELQVVDDQTGCPTGTADLARAILIAAERLSADASVGGLYHFAGTGATTWHGFASVIVDAQAAVTGRRPIVRAISTADYPGAAKRPANSQLDSSRFAETFGFRAMPWRRRTQQVVDALLSATDAVTS
jgi:dTDP-4-dehydrorhamnose reductase